MSELSHYVSLGLTPAATQADIKRAYKELVLKYHPDKVSGPEDTSFAFHLVQQAWEVLREETTRRQYDAQLREQQMLRHRIHQTVHTIEMVFDSQTNIYSHTCRCGGSYQIHSSDIFAGFSVVECDSCSFCIDVVAPHPSNPQTNEILVAHTGQESST